MFDIGWQEIFIIGILALIVVGPKDLPQAVRTISQWIRKARSMASELQGGVNEMIREAELDEIKKQITDVKSFDLQSELEKNIDPNGEIASGLGSDESLGLGDSAKEEMDEEAEGVSAPSPAKENESEGPISQTLNPQNSVPVAGSAAGDDEPDDDVMPAGPAPEKNPEKNGEQS